MNSYGLYTSALQQFPHWPSVVPKMQLSTSAFRAPRKERVAFWGLLCHMAAYGRKKQVLFGATRSFTSSGVVFFLTSFDAARCFKFVSSAEVQDLDAWPATLWHQLTHAPSTSPESSRHPRPWRFLRFTSTDIPTAPLRLWLDDRSNQWVARRLWPEKQP